MSQSAAIFGPQGAIEPLAGNVACDYCKIGPQDTYRWGPTRIGKRELLVRLAARYAEFDSWRDILEIVPIEKTSDGRAVQIRLVGEGSAVSELMAERFRLAVGSTIMRSTACDIRVAGQDVVFENGRGFGHGLGLCQWGAEGQVREGKRAAEVLRFYYPGSKLTRAY